MQPSPGGVSRTLPLSLLPFLVATAFFSDLATVRHFAGMSAVVYIAVLAALFAGRPAAQPSTHAARSTTVPPRRCCHPEFSTSLTLFAGLWFIHFSMAFCTFATAGVCVLGNHWLSLQPPLRPNLLGELLGEPTRSSYLHLVPRWPRLAYAFMLHSGMTFLFSSDSTSSLRLVFSLGL